MERKKSAKPRTVSKKTVKKEKTLDEILKRVMSNDEIEQIMDLKFENGDTILSIENYKDKEMVLEIMWLVKEVGFDAIYGFLNKKWEKYLKLEKTSSTMKRRMIIFENPIFSKNRKTLYMELYYFKNPVMISEGAVDCRKCGSSETLSAMKQSRSADEPSDIKVTCLHCGEHWRVQ